MKTIDVYETINSIKNKIEITAEHDELEKVEEEFAVMCWAKEAFDREEAYRWHDIVKNPEDLPECGGGFLGTKVMVWLKPKATSGGYADCVGYSKEGWNSGIGDWSNIVAWKYIEMPRWIAEKWGGE